MLMMTLHPKRRRGEPDHEETPMGLSQWTNVILKMTASTAVIVIAGFLVWKLSEQLEVYSDKMDTLSREHIGVATQAQTTTDLTRRMVILMRISCVNSAKNEAQRQACLQEVIP